MIFSSFFQERQRKFRQARMRWFVIRFDVSAGTNIIDVGGTRFNWDLISERPKVTMLNIAGERWVQDSFHYLVYDGYSLPFPNNSFDIAYSNSVIEHVGDWEAVENFAREIRRVAPAYYVQTPNRWFFIEPHIIGVFLHWLPTDMAKRLVPYLSIWGLREKPTRDQIDTQMNNTRLLTVKQMKRLFPEAFIVRERFFGMTKSIIAVRR